MTRLFIVLCLFLGTAISSCKKKSESENAVSIRLKMALPTSKDSHANLRILGACDLSFDQQLQLRIEGDGYSKTIALDDEISDLCDSTANTPSLSTVTTLKLAAGEYDFYLEGYVNLANADTTAAGVYWIYAQSLNVTVGASNKTVDLSGAYYQVGTSTLSTGKSSKVSSALYGSNLELISTNMGIATSTQTTDVYILDEDSNLSFDSNFPTSSYLGSNNAFGPFLVGRTYQVNVVTSGPTCTHYRFTVSRPANSGENTASSVSNWETPVTGASYCDVP